MLNSSPRWFSSGVPVSVIVKSRSIERTASVRCALTFFTYCASSTTTVANRRPSNPTLRRWSSPYETTSTSPGPSSASESERSSLHQRHFRLGMKRSSSDIQFDDTDAGAMMSCGPSAARAFKTAAVCTVLPSPMSSARMHPGAHVASRSIQATPSC